MPLKLYSNQQLKAFPVQAYSTVTFALPFPLVDRALDMGYSHMRGMKVVSKQ